jgi:hypothetical protein
MARIVTGGIHGVFVLANNTTKAHIEHWKNELKVQYETPDQYGNADSIEFCEVTDADDGSRYINFSVKQ